MKNTIDDLRRIAEIEFAIIIKDTFIIGYKLRILLVDDSFVDVNLSKKLSDRFGYHWESKSDKNEIYRYDNFPDKNWKFVDTYPYHFHNGSQENVENSPFPVSIKEGFRAFMEFVSNKINRNHRRT